MAFNSSNAQTSNGNDTFSLLNFANDASSSIKEAFNKPTKTRKVNIRKYIQKRVKRLNDAPSVSANKGVRAAKESTKSKSASSKPSQQPRRPVASSHQPPLHSQSLPLLGEYPQATSTSVSNTFVLQPAYSDSNLYPQLPQPIENAESSLDEILTFLGLESESTSTTPTMSRCSSDSTLATCVPPTQSILESQLPLAEHPLMDHPFSPNSDCSDELFDDSAYSSPCSSNGSRSYNCSPLPPTQAVSTGCEWVPAQSANITSTQFPAITSACNWMAGYGPQCAATTAAGYDYIPHHQSPSCDQVLLSPTAAIWDPVNYPEYF